MARTALLLPLLAAALAACVAAQQDAAASAAARAVAAAAAVSDRLASEQLGCVKDSQAARGLPTALGSGAMTPAKCRGLALAKKLKFYALQGGNDCWGGNTDPRPKGAAPGGCQTPCTGDASKTCGGTLENDAYRLTDTDREHVGCMVAPQISKYFEGVLVSNTSMTNNLCRAWAVEQGYKMYLTMGGTICYGSNNRTVADLKSAKESECNTTCPGDSRETCGGDFKYQIYTFVDAPAAPGKTCLVSITRKANTKSSSPLALNEVLLYDSNGTLLTSDKLWVAATSARAGYASVDGCFDGDLNNTGCMTGDGSTAPVDASPGLYVRFPCSTGYATTSLSKVVVYNSMTNMAWLQDFQIKFISANVFNTKFINTKGVERVYGFTHAASSYSFDTRKGPADRKCALVVSLAPDGSRYQFNYNSKILISNGDNSCPAGYRLITVKEANGIYESNVLAAIKTTAAAGRLAGGGSILKLSSSDANIKASDTKVLTFSVCTDLSTTPIELFEAAVYGPTGTQLAPADYTVDMSSDTRGDVNAYNGQGCFELEPGYKTFAGCTTAANDTDPRLAVYFACGADGKAASAVSKIAFKSSTYSDTIKQYKLDAISSDGSVEQTWRFAGDVALREFKLGGGVATTPCAAGSGGPNCTLCAAGAYSIAGTAAVPRPACAPCPANSTSFKAGGAGVGSCTGCAPGYGLSGTVCSLCAKGTWSAGGTASMNKPACRPCAPGNTTATTGATAAANCTIKTKSGIANRRLA